MTQTVQPTGTEPSRTISPALWRAAGGLALAHVVLLFAGFSQERSTALGAGPAEIRHAFVDGNLARIMAGGYVEAFSFVVLVPVLVFLARAVGTRTETARWASQTALAAGLGYVVVTLATGLPPGAAALYGGHHGADPATMAMVVDVRTFAFVLSLLILGLQALALGVAARSDRFFPRWVGFGGIVVGVLLFVAVAGAGLGLHDLGSMVWIVWWVGVGICLIRNASAAGTDARR